MPSAWAQPSRLMCASAAAFTLTNEPAVVDPGTLVVWIGVQRLLDEFEFWRRREE